jgi:SAM-dependent methyltransferase
LTLAPEAHCFWQKGISYLFQDLRDIPIRNSYYDTIACLSTLEHVGFNNTLFGCKQTRSQDRAEDFVIAMGELRRVLKSGGSLLLTVPFGAHRDLGAFQQFDRKLLSRAVEAFGESSEVVETFYRYTAEGWNVVEAEDCAECEYVEWISRPRDQWPRPLPLEPDRAAAARAVACVRLLKA